MNAHAPKTPAPNERSVANTTVQKKSHEQESSFEDQRPETLQNKSIQRMADGSPQTKKAAQLQQAADTNKKKTPIQKKENKTGLPDTLKSGIENLSGMAMDDVKVHYNSPAPAQLNAHAYAQGSDIHVASGQEKHLPHEAWHVVQQKQGRVKPTKQLKAQVAVNDDKGLEQEADAMGAKALSGAVQMKSESNALEIRPSATPPGSGLIQRKMGFEFETANTFEFESGGRWTAVGRTKDKPFYVGNGFKLEGDTGNRCEFILDPFEAKTTASKAAEDAATLAANIDFKADGYAIIDPSVEGTDKGWLKKTRIKKNGDDWPTSAQVTQGVKLADLPKYMSDHMNREQQGKFDAAKGKIDNVDIDTLDAAVNGFLQLVIKFVLDFKGWDGTNAVEGPKNAQIWMARTKYIAMAKSLGTKLVHFKNLFYNARNEWKADNPVTKATGVRGTDKIIKSEYPVSNPKRGQPGKISDPTTLSEWIKQLCDAAVKTDKMSPPKDYGGSDYGMGLLGMDEKSEHGTPLALLEYRNTSNRTEEGETDGTDITASLWSDYVEEQFDKALKWNKTLSDIDDDERFEGLRNFL